MMITSLAGCVKSTGEVELRTAERIFVESLHRIPGDHRGSV